MDFEKGQHVTIKKNLGRKNGKGRSEYYYGENIKKVPLHIRGCIEEIITRNKIVIGFGEKNSHNYFAMYVHPEELYLPAEFEKMKRKKNNPKISSLLHSEKRGVINFLAAWAQRIGYTIKNYRGKGEPRSLELQPDDHVFNPSFNPLREFAAWARQEFPQVFEGKDHCEQLTNRTDEVKNAAYKALAYATENFGRCQIEFFTKGYKPLVEKIETYQWTTPPLRTLADVVVSLRDFVQRIDEQAETQRGFPYVNQKRRGENDYGRGGLYID